MLHEFVTGNTDVKINCLRRCLQDLKKEKDEDIDEGQIVGFVDAVNWVEEAYLSFKNALQGIKN